MKTSPLLWKVFEKNEKTIVDDLILIGAELACGIYLFFTIPSDLAPFWKNFSRLIASINRTSLF